MKEEIKQIEFYLEKIADLALNLGIEDDQPKDYSKRAFDNVVVIFFHVFLDKIYSYQKSKGLNIEQLGIVAEEIGKSLRQTILLATGIDMHNIYKD